MSPSARTAAVRPAIPGLSFVSVDTETTGTDPQTARVVEFGACLFEDGQPGRSWQRLFHPGVPIPREASAVHGLCDQHVARCPPLSSWAQLPALLRSDRLCGYNLLAYDGPVLAAEAQRHLGLTLTVGGLDPLVFVRWHWRHLRRRNLGAVAAHLGIELTAAHSAAADARCAGEVLVELVRQGLVPCARPDALRLQAALAAELDEERARWGYQVYLCRRDRRTLRIGYGAHCGQPLEEVRTFMRWALGRHDRAARLPPERQPPHWRLPPAVAELFAQHVAERPSPRGQHALPIPAPAAAGLHQGGA